MPSRSALAGAVFACTAVVSLPAFQPRIRPRMWPPPAPPPAPTSCRSSTACACRRPPRPGRNRAPAPPRPAGTPPRESWHADPAKVFDNLYFVGQTEYSAWAVTTSAGIIVIDPLFDYSVADEVVDGLETLGLDPADIKYVIVSHGHSDHVGGASFLQDRYKARVVVSARGLGPDGPHRRLVAKPKRDIVATDGMRLTLGDTTLTLHLTPGHTLGTVSTLIPVRDGAAVTPSPTGAARRSTGWPSGRLHHEGRPDALLVRPVHRVGRDASATSPTNAGADVLLSNHTDFDGSKTKLPALATRRPGDPHPYVIGAAARVALPDRGRGVRARGTRRRAVGVTRGLVVCLPLHGHMAPLLPLVRELVTLGDDVTAYGTAPFAAAIESTGARFRPYRAGRCTTSPGCPTALRPSPRC